MDEVPDFPEPIVAYREWIPSQEGLRSIFNLWVIWEAGRPLKALCKNDSPCSDPPCRPERHHPWGNCGIYGFKSPDRLSWETPWTVKGKIRLWGRAWEHREGWRAEWAEVAGILTPPWPLTGSTVVDRQKVADTYGVGLEIWAPEVTP
jgi:hypothetical protein